MNYHSKLSLSESNIQFNIQPDMWCAVQMREIFHSTFILNEQEIVFLQLAGDYGFFFLSWCFFFYFQAF